MFKIQSQQVSKLGFEVRNKQISVPRAIGFNATFGGKEVKDGRIGEFDLMMSCER